MNGLLSRGFLRLVVAAFVVAAFVVAAPAAFFAMQRWLDGFAYREAMPWWLFAAAGALAPLIALAGPVRSLRYE